MVSTDFGWNSNLSGLFVDNPLHLEKQPNDALEIYAIIFKLYALINVEFPPENYGSEVLKTRATERYRV